MGQSRITTFIQFTERKSEKPAITFCISFLPCLKDKAKACTYKHGKSGYSWPFLVGVFFSNFLCYLLFRGCLAISKVESTKVTALYFYHCVLIHAWQQLATAGSLTIFHSLQVFKITGTISAFSLTLHINILPTSSTIKWHIVDKAIKNFELQSYSAFANINRGTRAAHRKQGRCFLHSTQI